MKIDKKIQGFTLIELLVVIAIIGILSTVVMFSVGTARDKGKDSSIKGQLNQIRAQASLYYDTAGNKYTGLFSDAKVLTLLNAAAKTSGGTAVTGETSSSWAAAVPLPYAGGYWCTDVTSFAGRITATTNVNNTTATCN